MPVRLPLLRRHAGFTLIELLVVLAVVALLLSIVAPRTLDHIDRARETTLRGSLKEMRSAIDQFAADQGRLPGALEELVGQRYLRELPIDPMTEKRDTWIVLTPAQLHPDEPRSGGGSALTDEGVADVRSGAEGNGRDGSAYRDW